MPKTKSGFTIVELLIVIVIIGTLAAITVVAYNGIQQRANNTKTISAAGAWVKAIQSYKAVHDTYPRPTDTCLGEEYPWDYEGTGSGMNQCRSFTRTYYTDKGLNAGLRSIIGNGTLPTPSFQSVGTESDWYRGILYSYSLPDANTERYQLSYILKGTSTCPSIGGTGNPLTKVVSGGVWCSTTLGEQPR